MDNILGVYSNPNTQEVTLCPQYLLEKYHLKVSTGIQKQVMAILRHDGR
ncbi:protein of unknown function [Candidatus Nitrosocosmicus franklandus]|uniref:Uncharacterized protein n=1 Tax=Candidatus Nitrosocosmicus franklandianus TaxID=1798806 RepID=A0A484IDZ5_9ARCH|nr:protein of unknown function [Candidatus Nitrosocosmicus franklandus]